DRISKQATEPQFKGDWNYWAFTKNSATGNMRIYLNGELWHSGTALTRGFDEIEIFKIASNANGYGRYDGSMDNFAVWNRELSEGEIENTMRSDYLTDKTSQLWNGLLFYYDMNNITENNIPDVTGNGHDGTAHGFPEIRTNGVNRTMVTEDYEQKLRPIITFVKGEFSGNFDIERNSFKAVREYPVPKDEVFIYDYDSPNREIPADELKSFSENIKVPTKIMSVYPANKPIYTYSEFGSVIDSVVAEPTDSLIKENINYYSPVVDYEIHRFITPYGINLDLGPDGFTWIEDVSDFEPILRDFVKLRAGNQQELIDLKFYFIKGTPARKVKSVQTLWSSG
ncbi:MAG: LamG-like jellyroll fold domain-containing protein, partial [Candidatus Kapaibacterium sp.]